MGSLIYYGEPGGDSFGRDFDGLDIAVWLEDEAVDAGNAVIAGG